MPKHGTTVPTIPAAVIALPCSAFVVWKLRKKARLREYSATVWLGRGTTRSGCGEFHSRPKIDVWGILAECCRTGPRLRCSHSVARRMLLLPTSDIQPVFSLRRRLGKIRQAEKRGDDWWAISTGLLSRRHFRVLDRSFRTAPFFEEAWNHDSDGVGCARDARPVRCNQCSAALRALAVPSLPRGMARDQDRKRSRVQCLRPTSSSNFSLIAQLT